MPYSGNMGSGYKVLQGLEHKQSMKQYRNPHGWLSKLGSLFGSLLYITAPNI